jgi:hypothetical protein
MEITVFNRREKRRKEERKEGDGWDLMQLICMR